MKPHPDRTEQYDIKDGRLSKFPNLGIEAISSVGP